MSRMAYNRVRNIMKKAFTLIAAMVLMASMVMAQGHSARRLPQGKAPLASHKLIKQHVNTSAPKDAEETITEFPWTLGFETGETGYTFIDADGDGFNWGILTASEDNFHVHGGDGVATSASYDNATEAPLTPDNWMILPAFEIPTEAEGFELTWYARGQDVEYYEENYSVYISTTGNAVADFTTAVATATTTNEWVKGTVSLEEYAGETIYIAFRHHNCTDMFFLDIDDIRVGLIEAPEDTIAGPAVVRMGEPTVFTAVCESSAEFEWNTDATDATYEGNTATLTWETAGTGNVSVTATNIAGNSTDAMEVTVIDCTEIISEFPYNFGFEGSLGCWQAYASDPENTNELGVSDEGSFEGENSFIFSSYSIVESENYTQYLISPEFALPVEGSYMARFMYFADSEAESFQMLASTTTDDEAAFTNVLFTLENTVEEEWTEMACVLPADAKYVAFKYYGNWAYNLYIDDFSIETLTAPTVTLDGPASIGTNQDAVFTAFSPLAESLAWTIDGAAVSSTEATITHVFTTAGEHTVSVTATNSEGSATASFTVDVFNCEGATLPYVADFSEGLHCWSNRSDLTEGYGWMTSAEAMDVPEGQVLSLSADLVWGMFMMDVDVDNWLISPVITKSEGNYDIAWKVKPYTTQYAGDHYAVYVIANGQETMLREETLNASMTNFTQRTVALPANINGEFRIAFRHFNNAEGYVIMLDDIKIVEAGSVAIDDVNSSNVAVYPNPVTDRLNVEGEGISEVNVIDLNGRTVASAHSAGVIDLSAFSTGMYIVRVVAADGVHTSKIVKK